MKSLLTLALPTLALSAALTPRQQTPEVRVISARSISNGPGSGCPTGHFSTQLDTAANTLTILFDSYDVVIGPNVNPSERETFCDFEVTFNFPVGCTTGTISTRPGGTIRLQNRFESSFSASYSIEKGSITRSPAELRFTSANFGAPVGEYKDYERDHPASVRVNIANENERNVVYRATTRIFLNQPGISPTENSFFVVDHADIIIRDVAKC